MVGALPVSEKHEADTAFTFANEKHANILYFPEFLSDSALFQRDSVMSYYPPDPNIGESLVKIY